jgi:hypothetical protein
VEPAGLEPGRPSRLRRDALSNRSLTPRPCLSIFLVEPAGFEPATFPVSPGRAYQLFDERSILPRFDLPLAPHRFGTGTVGF